MQPCKTVEVSKYQTKMQQIKYTNPDKALLATSTAFLTSLRLDSATCAITWESLFSTGRE